MPDAKSPLSTSASRKPAGRGVERDAGAGDAAADDEHVEVLGGEPAQRIGAIERHRAVRLPAGFPGLERSEITTEEHHRERVLV